MLQLLYFTIHLFNDDKQKHLSPPPIFLAIQHDKLKNKKNCNANNFFLKSPFIC